MRLHKLTVLESKSSSVAVKHSIAQQLAFKSFTQCVMCIFQRSCLHIQTGTPGRQAHPLRKASLSGGSKKQSFPKEDQDLTSARSVSHAEALSGQTANLVGSATESEACFNMVNFILGAGVLGYPFCYKACGLVLTTLLILVCLVAAQLSMRLLLMSSQLSGKRTYEELARLCFGKPGQRVMGTCVFMLNLGALVAYVNILADVLSSVAGSIIPPGAEPSRNIIMTGGQKAR